MKYQQQLTETISKVTTNVFSDHSRSITHIHKYNNVDPNRLMIDTVLKSKSGIAYANDLTIFIVIYGAKWCQNDVDTSVWDRVYELVNNTVKYEVLVEVKDPVRPGSRSHYKESPRSWRSKNGVSIFVLL